MRLVFCGTPEFAVATLHAAVGAGHQVLAVVTQPDRAVGRGLELHAPPVKLAALELGLPVLQPERIKDNVEFRALLEQLRPDAILVVAYGRIIPQWMLELAPLGALNLHGSLLPKYRGAAPIQWAIANGETVTGVTTMHIDAGLDTGDMLLARAVPIGEYETAVDLFAALADVGAELMLETLSGLAAGTILRKKQDNDLATLAPLLKREDGWMDFARTAKESFDRWRGFQPWPGAHTKFHGKKLVVHCMHVAGDAPRGGLGEILVTGDSVQVVCGGGTLLGLDELQLEGKRRMSAAEFLRGHRIRSGERLGE